MRGISRYLQEFCLGLGIVLSSGLGFAATVTWNNPAGGDWHTGVNWDTGNVPVDGDDAVIGNIGGNTVTYSAGTTNLNSFSAGDNLRITGGILNIAAASNVDAGTTLTLSSGALGGAGSLTVNGNFDWGSAGSLSVAGGVVTKATTNLIGAGDKDLGTTWDNDGTVNFNEGDFDLQTSNAVFNNNATFNIVTTNTGDVIKGNASGTAETFSNFGDLNKPNSGTIRIVLGTFINSGNVDIDMGTLKIESPNTTHTGTYDLASNATLESIATNHEINTTSPFDAASAGRFLVSSGTVNFNSDSTVLPAGLELDFDAGTLGGTGNVEINGTFNWGSAGSLSVAGGVVTKATTNLIGAGDKDLGTTWDNDGTVNFNDGDFDLQDASAVFNNNATFNIVTVDPSDVIEGNASGNAETFNNEGTLNKPNSGTITVRPGTFNNSGNVDVGAGTLNIATGGGGTSPGDFMVSVGATLEFDGGTHDLSDADVSGMGTVDFDSGTVTLADTGAPGGSYSVEATTFTGGTANFNFAADTNSLTLTSGTMSGSGNFTVNNQFSWNGTSTMTGSGTTVVPAAANLTISTTAIKEFRRTLQHNSTTGMSEWTGGRVDFLDGTFNNTGNFDIKAANNLDTDGGTNAFNNTGTLTGNSTGTAFFKVPLNNTGSLAVQGGALSLDAGGTSPGDFSVSGGTTLEFDGGIHDLTDADVSGMGTVDFDGGTVTLADTGAPGGSYSVEATTFTGGNSQFQSGR